MEQKRREELADGLTIPPEGAYTVAEHKGHRVSVCIGRDHETVGPELGKEVAIEAGLGVWIEILFVCGFAFDSHASENAIRHGNLTVLSAGLTPDHAMADKLLKKTGAGNMFMFFLEPDIYEKNKKDGKYGVKIKGLDKYSPTTGEVRSSGTDGIACCFIDTDNNRESFFVRHAFFSGADKSYYQLNNDLCAGTVVVIWKSFCATNSRPFDTPKTGMIAIKVTNHFGDEVLKCVISIKFCGRIN